MTTILYESTDARVKKRFHRRPSRAVLLGLRHGSQREILPAKAQSLGPAFAARRPGAASRRIRSRRRRRDLQPLPNRRPRPGRRDGVRRLWPLTCTPRIPRTRSPSCRPTRSLRSRTSSPASFCTWQTRSIRWRCGWPDAGTAFSGLANPARSSSPQRRSEAARRRCSAIFPDGPANPRRPASFARTTSHGSQAFRARSSKRALPDLPKSRPGRRNEPHVRRAAGGRAARDELGCPAGVVPPRGVAGDKVIRFSPRIVPQGLSDPRPDPGEQRSLSIVIERLGRLPNAQRQVVRSAPAANQGQMAAPRQRSNQRKGIVERLQEFRLVLSPDRQSDDSQNQMGWRPVNRRGRGGSAMIQPVCRGRKRDRPARSWRFAGYGYPSESRPRRSATRLCAQRRRSGFRSIQASRIKLRLS